MQPRILVVDDTPETLSYLEDLLEQYGFLVTTEESSNFVLQRARALNPDLILLDYSFPFPQESGLDILEKLREDPQTAQIPVILMTGYEDKDHRLEIEAMHERVIDFIEKPINGELLIAIIENRLFPIPSKREKTTKSNILKCGIITADLEERVVYVKGRPTEKFRFIEFEILNLFLKNRNKILSRIFIIESIWGHADVYPNTIDKHIQNIREKLGLEAAGCIETVFKEGYRLNPKAVLAS